MNDESGEDGEPQRIVVADAVSGGAATQSSFVEMPDGETGPHDYRKLCERSVTLDRGIGYVVFSVIFLVILGTSTPTMFFPNMPAWGIAAIVAGWVGVGIVMFLLAHSVPRWSYERTTWAMTPEGFEIRRGILWRHHIAIPAARVQHVDVSQGPLQRMFDLGKLTIHTAGTKNAALELSGLEHATALGLRDELVRQKELAE